MTGDPSEPGPGGSSPTPGGRAATDPWADTAGSTLPGAGPVVDPADPARSPEAFDDVGGPDLADRSPAVERASRARTFPLWPSLLLAAGWVAADQVTKHWAVNALADRDVDVIGSLRFNLHFNSGMAFSQGTGIGPIIGVFGLVVVVALLISLRRSDSRISSAGVGLVIGGALGNIVDRLFRGDAWFRGRVVDFIDLQWFPIFNVADIGVNIGAGLLILGTLLAARRARRTAGVPR